MTLELIEAAPDDYVLATGELHSVRELVEIAFEMVGRRIEWRGITYELKSPSEAVIISRKS